MVAYEVTLGHGGSGTFKVIVHAATPDMARRNAEHMNPGYVAQSVTTSIKKV